MLQSIDPWTSSRSDVSSLTTFKASRDSSVQSFITSLTTWRHDWWLIGWLMIDRWARYFRERSDQKGSQIIHVQYLTLYGHIKTAEQRTIIQQYGDWYTGRWWLGCYIWYSEEGTGQAVAYQLHIIRCGTVITSSSWRVNVRRGTHGWHFIRCLYVYS